MKIHRGEFKKYAGKLTRDLTIQKLESVHYVFIRFGGTVTVKFKGINGLTGYFTPQEIADQKSLTFILKTLEKELEKNGK